MPAVAILRRCANRIPPSVACEAAIGMALSTTKKHRAYARYYMAAAADIDDPAVGADTYRTLAKAAHDDGQFDTEASALTIVVARDGATAEDYSALAGALSADPQRRDEAAEAYGKAYAADGTRYEDLRKRSVLLAQLGQAEEAIQGFEEYIEKAGAHSPHRMGVQQRIAELKARLEKK
jgi:tetratricopeptide (TPR) repeat protein